MRIFRISLLLLLLGSAGCKGRTDPAVEPVSRRPAPDMQPTRPDLTPAADLRPDLPPAPDAARAADSRAPVPGAATPAPVKPAPPGPAPAKASRPLTGTALWNDLLRRRCKGGRVDYSGIHAEDRQALDRFVAYLGRRSAPAKNRAGLAFYLNAYNALVIKALVDRWPSKGVRTVPGFFKRLTHRVAGKAMTLDQLENKVIRPLFKDPRIHFALVCGARSCPPLRCRAFYGGGLDRVLDSLTRRFINSRLGVQQKDGALRVSKLFTWYAGDFEAAAGTVGKYLARHHKTLGPKLATGSLEFQPYSWALNGK